MPEHPPVHPRRLQDLWDALLARRGDEAAFRELVAGIHVPVLLVDNDQRYSFASASSRLFLRRTLAELRGLRMHDLLPERQHANLEAVWAELLAAGEVAGSMSLRAPDGGEIPIDYRGAANVLPGTHLFVWIPSWWADVELTDGFTEPRKATRGILTERERDILALVATGATIEQIAAQRNLSVSTVRTHLRNALRRLGARHRTHALAIALREGELELD